MDSLLRGFPLGSLLLVNTDKDFFELSDAKTKKVKKANYRHTQIVDGQQRCMATLKTFAGQGLLNNQTGDVEQL